MKYEIVREARGKKTVLDSGALPKMRDRLRQLRQSTRAGVFGRGGKKYAVTYQLRETSPRTGCYHCLHTKTARGKDAPRAWGSWRTQVCLDCGAFRMHAQDDDPSSPVTETTTAPGETSRPQFWRHEPVTSPLASGGPAATDPAPDSPEAATCVRATTAVELRIELAPRVVLALSAANACMAVSPADVHAIRAASAPLLAELASRRLAADPDPGGDE